jgi:hypothetical protein
MNMSKVLGIAAQLSRQEQEALRAASRFGPLSPSGSSGLYE